MGWICRANRYSRRQGEGEDAFLARCDARWGALRAQGWIRCQREAHLYKGRRDHCHLYGGILGTCFEAPAFDPLLHPTAYALYIDCVWRFGYAATKRVIRAVFRSAETIAAMEALLSLISYDNPYPDFAGIMIMAENITRTIDGGTHDTEHHCHR